jgi:hypothetical protein
MTSSILIEMKALDIAAISICAALYAGLGFLTYLGLFTPVFGVVRFWPSVIIPAIFAVLFGPLVGAIGAAIGIFISDMVIHGNALLSLTVGVPANFAGFYLLGYLSRKKLSWISIFTSSTIINLAISIVLLLLYTGGYLGIDIFTIFILTILITYISFIAVSYILKRWRSYVVGSFVGLTVGSIIIGIGVWGFSQIFALPAVVGGGYQLAFYAAIIFFVWTFVTEIPFLIILGPPLLSIAYNAIPQLRWEE